MFKSRLLKVGCHLSSGPEEQKDFGVPPPYIVRTILRVRGKHTARAVWALETCWCRPLCSFVFPVFGICTFISKLMTSCWRLLPSANIAVLAGRCANTAFSLSFFVTQVSSPALERSLETLQ